MKKRFVAILLAVMFFMVGCNGMIDLKDPDNPATQIFLEEIADTVGYALGAFARKSPELQGKAEELYNKYHAGGITVTDIMNEGLVYLVDTDDTVQLALAHKIKRLIVRMGGQVSEDWNIIDMGLIDEELLSIGKDAYLAALNGTI